MSDMHQVFVIRAFTIGMMLMIVATNHVLMMFLVFRKEIIHLDMIYMSLSKIAFLIHGVKSSSLEKVSWLMVSPWGFI